MKFFDQAGPMALGSRVRLIAEKMTEDASAINQMYGNPLHPKWFPVFYVLSHCQEITANQIAEDIGHSHASVSKILSEMQKAGLVVEKIDPKDRRRALLSLTSAGKRIAKNIEGQYLDVAAAVEQMKLEAKQDLWAALAAWDRALQHQTLFERILKIKNQREMGSVKIIDYQTKYKQAFFDLNREWIVANFKLETPDIEALKNPKKYILSQGGHILVALDGTKPVGVCALIKKDKKVYELAKMAVAPKMRGKQIGWLLGQAIISKARALKAETLYLESNTKLKPAIALYQKLGFKKFRGPPSPYERCNIQMELKLGS